MPTALHKLFLYPVKDMVGSFLDGVIKEEWENGDDSQSREGWTPRFDLYICGLRKSPAGLRNGSVDREGRKSPNYESVCSGRHAIQY
jgi:hypothetical protein